MMRTPDADMMKIAKHRLDCANHRAEKLVELGAADLAEIGASSYAAGIRMLLFYAIGLLVQLAEPELRSDLERIKSHCDMILEELNKTAA